MYKPLYALIAAGLCSGLVVFAAWAADSKVDPRVALAAKLPNDVKPEELTPAAIPGFYELRRGTEIGYVSSDGRYYFSGELLDLNTRINLTEQSLREVRKKLLAAVPESEMIVFGPPAQYTLTVFTDVDCGYCRQMHAEVPQLNKMGVRVRYLFYPRSGPGSPSWKEAEKVWCAPDRGEALTRVKRGEPLPARSCRSNPIAKQYALGNTLGIRGTPGIFTQDGDYLKGYLPPAQLLALLRRLETS